MNMNSTKMPEVRQKMALQLPCEIWSLISEPLTTKEWARASGTCKATAAVKPRILIHVPKDHAELKWICSRWAEAGSLGLDLRTHGLLEPATVQMMISSLQHMPSMHAQQLALSCRTAQSAGVQYVQKLLAAAPNLCMLSLNTACIPALPALQNLRHLHLKARRVLAIQSSRSLIGLRALETLSIEILQVVEGSPARLDLEGYSHLQAVTLVKIIPRRLQLPALRSLCVEADFEALMPEWDSIRYCCSILRIRTYLPTRCTRMIGLLKHPFAVLTRLDILVMLFSIISTNVANVGSCSCPLVIGASLHTLKYLCVEANDIHMLFEPGLSLKDVSCTAFGKLHAVARDMAMFMADLKSLNMSWYTGGPPTLVAHMQVQLGCKRCYVGKEFGCYSFGAALVHRIERPTCGACDICLVEKGLVGQSSITDGCGAFSCRSQPSTIFHDEYCQCFP